MAKANWMSIKIDERRVFSSLIEFLAPELSGSVDDRISQLQNTLPDYTSKESFELSYLKGEIFSKLSPKALPKGSRKTKPKVRPLTQLEVTALERFREGEKACSATNFRLTRAGAWKHAPAAIESAKDWVHRILGPFNWNECAARFSFGPGATFTLPRTKSAECYKYSGKPETTSGNMGLACAALRHSMVFSTIDIASEMPETFEIVPGNRVTTVPKNYKTDRTIGIEPRMNMYIQKGIGSVIRSRLKRYGCDLNDQTGNQTKAFIGSRYNTLSTIDLSMASDTVSREIVALLLPPDWLLALEQCRSVFGVLPSGETLFYQKFSSMGNGYTFELESLIFYALCLACRDLYGEKGDILGVYGDDLIVRGDYAQHLIEALEWSGFTPNLKKTHLDGPFRESCGKHYFHGEDVSPFYIKRRVTRLDVLFLLHNNLWRWGQRTGRDVTVICKRLMRFAPAYWRTPRLLDGFGDGAFVGHLHEIPPSAHPDGWEGWSVEVLANTAEELSCYSKGQLPVSLDYLERGVYELDAGITVRPSRVGALVTTNVFIKGLPLLF